MDGSDADFQLLGGLVDARPAAEHALDIPFRCVGKRRSSCLLGRASETSAHAFGNHGALELGKDPEHLKHGSPAGGRGVDSLDVQVEIDVLGLKGAGLLSGRRRCAAPPPQAPLAPGAPVVAATGHERPRLARTAMLRSRTKSNGETYGAEKLDMDLIAVLRRHAHMNDLNNELIDLLCTRIGAIMEDASVVALTIRAGPPEERVARIMELERASASIAAMTAAAASLI